MPGRAKFGIAAVMMLLVLATAPAVLCLSYLAQNIQAHDCCPPKTPPAVKPTCCIHSPAVTSSSVDVPAPSVATFAPLPVDPLPITASIESATVADLDMSPPGCSSILRI
jgi:hypothetical protein